MKKYLVLCLAIMCLFVTGCGSEDGKKSDGGVKSVKTEKKSQKANIEETVIFDKKNIKVTAKKISYDDYMGPEIKLLIENDSDKNITVQARNFSINGIMIDPIFSADVAAGKKSNDEISILSDDLETAKIYTIKDIEFGLHIFNSDTWNDIINENDIKLETNATNYEQKYNTDGELVVDEKDIKIYVLKKDDKDSFWGADIYLYIENNSSKNITVQTRDVSINGFMVDPVFSADVSAGKKIYDEITFLEDDLKDNDITSVDELELKFHIFNQDSWKDVLNTKIKKITFEK